jgi:hypothetical protein
MYPARLILMTLVAALFIVTGTTVVLKRATVCR